MCSDLKRKTFGCDVFVNNEMVHLFSVADNIVRRAKEKL